MLGRVADRVWWPVAVALAVAGCSLGGHGAASGSGADATSQSTMAASGRASRLALWTGGPFVADVVDLSARRADGSIVIAAAGRLLRWRVDGAIGSFAPAYSAPAGLEPYIAASSGQRVADAGCRFAPGDIFALRLDHGNGVTVVDPRGRVSRFASLPRRGLENGIAFDTTGRFGHRLLVTATTGTQTTVFSIDCRGRARVLTTTAPKVEGGMAVAPADFGRFGGDLIAPNELSGMLYAIGPSGHALVLSASGIAHGQDVGVESEGFVPRSFADALVSDRLTPGNPHPGDNVILAIAHGSLTAAGVAAGDLLVAGEGGATTIAVRCRQACRTRVVAVGPSPAHIEGHIVFR